MPRAARAQVGMGLSALLRLRSARALCGARARGLMRNRNAIFLQMLLPVSMVVLGFASPSFLHASGTIAPEAGKPCPAGK